MVTLFLCSPTSGNYRCCHWHCWESGMLLQTPRTYVHFMKESKDFLSIMKNKRRQHLPLSAMSHHGVKKPRKSFLNNLRRVQNKFLHTQQSSMACLSFYYNFPITVLWRYPYTFLIMCFCLFLWEVGFWLSYELECKYHLAYERLWLVRLEQLQSIWSGAYS